MVLKGQIDPPCHTAPINNKQWPTCVRRASSPPQRAAACQRAHGAHTQTLIMRHVMARHLGPQSHLFRVDPSSAPLVTPNGRIVSKMLTTPACCCGRRPERPPLRKSGARSAPECVDGSSSDLQSGVERNALHSSFEVCEHGSAMPSVAASLRGAFATFFAKAKVPTNCGVWVQRVGL